MWMGLIQSIEDLNRTRLSKRELLLSKYLSWNTSLFLPSYLSWHICSSWVSNLLAFLLGLTPSALLVLRLLNLDCNYNTDTHGSSACWLQICGLLSLHNHVKQSLILGIFIFYWFLPGEPLLIQLSANSHVRELSWKPQRILGDCSLMRDAEPEPLTKLLPNSWSTETVWHSKCLLF